MASPQSSHTGCARQHLQPSGRSAGDFFEGIRAAGPQDLSGIKRLYQSLTLDLGLMLNSLSEEDFASPLLRIFVIEREGQVGGMAGCSAGDGSALAIVNMPVDRRCSQREWHVVSVAGFGVRSHGLCGRGRGGWPALRGADRVLCAPCISWGWPHRQPARETLFPHVAGLLPAL